MIITSKQNALIKKISSLSDKKNRDELGQYIVEGVKMVKEAIAFSCPVEKLVCTEKGLSLLGENNLNAVLVSDEVFSIITGEKTPQGVLAVVKKPNVSLAEPRGNCVLLDGVADPGNVGTIIRTMACAGIKDLYLTPDCADAFSPKAVRSSMSGIFKVKIHYGERENILNVLNRSIVIADMSGENVFETKVENDFCLVIGNEAHGVSDFFRSHANKFVRIPMEKDMESLNAGVSAGILIYVIKNLH